MDNKGRAGLGNPMRIVYAVIGIVVLFSVMVSLIPTGADSINELLGSVEGNTTVYGTGPSALAGVFADIWGYVLVAGLIGLIFLGVKRLTGNKGM